MAAKKEKASETVKAAAEVLGRAIIEHGWISTVQLGEVAKDAGIALLDMHSAMRLLDRSGAITARKGPNQELGWETLVGAGKGAKRYGGHSARRRLRMVFSTAPLGPQSKDGLSFRFVRDQLGKIQFTPGNCRAMLHKAYQQSGLAGEEGMVEASVNRIYIRFEGVHEEGIVSIVRRPVNDQGQAVGELIHEGLAPGSWAEWTFAFPETHYSADQAARLLDAAETVGFSQAGSGKSGGNHGLFSWASAGEQPQ